MLSGTRSHCSSRKEFLRPSCTWRRAATLHHDIITVIEAPNVTVRGDNSLLIMEPDGISYTDADEVIQPKVMHVD